MAYVGTYLALTLAFFVLLHLTGHAASRRLLDPLVGLPAVERATLAMTIGVAVWVAILFALAALQLLRPAPIWTAVAVTAAWGTWSLLRPAAGERPRRPPHGDRAPRERDDRANDAPDRVADAASVAVWGVPPAVPSAPAVGQGAPGAVPGTPGALAGAPVAMRGRAWRFLRDPVALAGAAVLAVVFAALFAQALRPIVAWDADVYHLTVPRLYLEHGGFRSVPFNVYSNWPLAAQLLFALAMTMKDYVLAAAVHFGFGAILAVSTGAVVARVAGPAWGVIAAGLLAMHPVLLYEVRVAYVDVACAFFLFAGFLALHRALEDPAHERRLMLLAGIACGLLAAAKLNGFFGAGAVAAIYLASRAWSGAAPRATAATLLAFAGPVAALGIPWLGKSLWLTGNPVYPLLYDVFGGPDWSEALGRAHRTWQRSIGMGRSPADYLLLPFRVLFLGGEGYARFDGRLHPLLGILLPVALYGARRLVIVRRALAVAGLYFVLWAATSQQMRFLIPVLPLLSIAVAVSGHDLVRRIALRGVAGRAGAADGAAPPWGSLVRALPRLAAAVLVGVVAALLIRSSAVYLEQAPRLYAALWQRGDALRAHATDEVWTVIDERLPRDARLLFVNVNRGFFCRREFVADSFFEASQVAALLHQLGDRERIRRGLAERGITHVLLERQEHGPRYPPGFGDLLRDPQTRVVYRSPDERFTVFSLAPAGTS